MKKLYLLLALCGCLSLYGQESLAQQAPNEKVTWIDLTYPFSEKTLYWPNNPRGFTMDTLYEGTNDHGFYYSSYSFFAPEHGGTHLDAPVHFAEGKRSVDQLLLDQLIGDAVVIDVSFEVSKNRDYQILVKDVIDWEQKHGQLPDSVIVLFRTGYGEYYPNPLLYFGTDQKGEEAIPLLHFPGIHPDLASWLVQNRRIKAIGLDVASIDYGQSTDFMSHRILLGENIPAFENVANLHLLPPIGIYLIALPMLIEGGSGGPVRIIARVK